MPVDVVYRPESSLEFALTMIVGIGMRLDSVHLLHSNARSLGGPAHITGNVFGKPIFRTLPPFVVHSRILGPQSRTATEEKVGGHVRIGGVPAGCPALTRTTEKLIDPGGTL